MLKTLLEQFVLDEYTVLHEVKSLLVRTKYTYYNTDLNVYLSAIVNTPFKYSSEQMLNLVHNDILTLSNVSLSSIP